MTSPQELTDLVGRFTALGAGVAALQETELRVEFIDPLFQILGWDMANQAGAPHHIKDVLREEAQTSRRPDYTFRLEGQRKYFAEAKRADVDVRTHAPSARQARSYSWTAGLPIAVLTNFRTTRIYDARHEPLPGDDADVALLAEFDSADYGTRFDELYGWLSREAIASGTIEQRLDIHLSSISPANAAFLRRVDAWRLAIATDLAATTALDGETLSDVAQKLINRIIFIRMCEDRGIEGEERLRAVASARQPIAVRELFAALNDRYNTGLFDVTQDPYHQGIVLDPDVLLGIIDQVYAPQSPYSFGVLDADFIGQVYEHFLAKRIELSATRDVTLVVKAAYEDREVVTTPQVIVNEIVRRAIEARCEKLPANPTLDDLLAIRVLDIAVGSGRFLVRALDQLCDVALRFNPPGVELIPRSDGSAAVSFQTKRQIATQCLYGIDIDFNACEVTKFSLMIKLLEEELADSLPAAGALLPNFDSNVAWGNSVVEQDTGDPSSRPLRWIDHGFPERFDVIIGNPPYMKTEDMRAKSRAEFDYYKRVYSTPFKQFDKYFVFVERAISKLTDNGVLGILIPNKWMTIEAGARLRELMVANNAVTEIVDFGNLQVFEGKSVYVCMVLALSQGDERLNYRMLYSLDSFKTDPQGLGRNLGMAFVAAYGGSPWVLPGTDQEAEVLQRIRANSQPLSDFCEVQNGIQTSGNSIYVIPRFERRLVGGVSYIAFSNDGLDWEIEEALTRPFVHDPESVQAWTQVSGDARVIFPYVDVPGQYPRVMTPAELQAAFPKGWDYLRHFEAMLRRRDVQPIPAPDVFYAYGRMQALETVLTAPKIIYSVNQRGDRYGLDTTGTAYASGGTAGEAGVVLRQDSPYSLEFVLALLLQRPIELYLRKRGSPFRGGYYARGSAVLSDTPVPVLDMDDPAIRLIHDSITASVHALTGIHRAMPTCTPRDRVILLRDKARLIREISAAFQQIWGFAVPLETIELPE